jgi:hypothetical protein
MDSASRFWTYLNPGMGWCNISASNWRKVEAPIQLDQLAAGEPVAELAGISEMLDTWVLPVYPGHRSFLATRCAS